MPSFGAVLLGIAMLGGGTVGLAPGDEPPDSPPPGSDSGPDPGDEPASPGLPGAIGLSAAAAALAMLQRRDGSLSPAGGLGLRPAPIFVFVPGHGQPAGRRAFDDLVDLMGLDDDSVRYFDYRWVTGSASHGEASEDVGIDDATAALNAYLAGIASGGDEMYLVGFSKGGATVAELLADWDDGHWGPGRSVVGAALLDPPMARGPHGWLQSVGRHVGFIPDDGGYEPVQCRFLRVGCEDRRAHLGAASGIEVVVVRNPRAAITSFADVPDGLRVYDAADDGPTPWAQLLSNPFGLPGRITAAHEAVLHDPRVAACLLAEVQAPRSCDLPLRRPPPRLPGLGGGATRAPVPQKVL